MGVEYQMSVAPPAPRPIVVGIVLSRRHTDFSERDRAMLNALRPHLVQAWFNAKDQAHLRSLLSAARDATGDSGAGLIVLSDPPHELRRVRWCRCTDTSAAPPRRAPCRLVWSGGWRANSHGSTSRGRLAC